MPSVPRREPALQQGRGTIGVAAMFRRVCAVPWFRRLRVSAGSGLLEGSLEGVVFELNFEGRIWSLTGGGWEGGGKVTFQL